MTDRSESNLTEIVDRVTRQTYERAKHDDMPEFDSLPPNVRMNIKQGILPTVMAVLDIVDAEPHKAKRGDEVEAFIKRARERWVRGDGSLGDRQREYDALDDLLDDYRLHADTGTSLDRDPEV